MSRPLAIVAVIGLFTGTLAHGITPEQEEHFERFVRPVLAEHCVGCHGPETQENGLRLDSAEAFLAGGESGALVSADSLLLRALSYEAEPKMPPTGPLPANDIEGIRKWIAMGAPWPESGGPIEEESFDAFIRRAREEHWAFRPVTPPTLSDDENAIDQLIIARLSEAKLNMNPRADRRTLIRRAYHDLWGIPPTPESVQQFVADESSDAYARMVENLLASTNFGERWGRHWLDVARYSDTKGYVFQEDRNFAYSHTYRDYVIRAYNEDLPLTEFIKHQLAADMMELGEDKRPLAAMGYVTLGRRFVGNIHDVMDDRIDVVTRGMLGLTVTCARCHEHKYDPIPAEDYYSLYGVFRSASEPGEPPLIREPNREDPQYQEYERILAERQKVHDDFFNETHERYLNESRMKLAEYLMAAYEMRDVTDQEPLRTLARDRKLIWQIVQRWRDHLNAKKEAPGPIYGPWHAFAALPAEGFTEAAKPVVEQVASGKLGEQAINGKLASAFKGQSPASMRDVVNIYTRAIRDVEREWQDKLASQAQIAAAGNAAVRVPGSLGDADAEALRLVLYGDDSPGFIKPNEVRSIDSVPTRDQFTRLRNSINNHKATHPGRPDRAMALVDTGLFNPYVFKRGKPGNKGPEVPRQFLTVLVGENQKPFEVGSGRLELAEAIASETNPLTARVYVNRVWMQLMGTPLVGTPSDFGLRSDPPTHPELLDYLAHEFMANNWSTKWLVRTIMNSATYTQQSFDNPAAREVDPENELLWRQNRKRLDFESMRDSYLAVGGNLDATMGGPSVPITTEPFSTRRTVYARIERQNLPGLFRTFDFASPDTHTPQRFETTVPQQALFLLNSPFMIQQSRALAARVTAEDSTERARQLFQLAYQRDATDTELADVAAFIERAKATPPRPDPPAPTWQYGYGRVDTEAGTTATFTPYPHFTGKSWQGGAKLPDEKLNWSSLTATGGHPGTGPELSAIRRWVAPASGSYTIKNRVVHASPEGDGVVAYIVHSRHGVLWQTTTHNTEHPKELQDVEVEQGDVIDFIITCNGNTSHDSFQWRPHLTLTTGVAEGGRTVWWSKDDFAGPPPKLPEPLMPWEQLAQVLLLSNEFQFVD